MATSIEMWVEKATFTTADLTGAANGGQLSNEQARVFLRDAIEATVMLSASDVFDSASPKFEIPKINFANRIMRAGTQFTRLAAGDQTKPDTDLVTLSTALFRGEVPVSDEVFEDNVEQGGLADSLMGLIAEAVGRDLEEIAIKSKTASATLEFAQLPDQGIIQQLIASTTNQEFDATAVTSYRALFQSMIDNLPSRYRRAWDQFVFYVPVAVADNYAEELGDRGTALGDNNVEQKTRLRYRGVPVEEVPLLSGTSDAVNYATFAILCQPKNLKTGFHRRVRVEKWRDPREGGTSFIPSVRFDVKWAQDSATVLGKSIPSL